MPLVPPKVAVLVAVLRGKVNAATAAAGTTSWVTQSYVHSLLSASWDLLRIAQQHSVKTECCLVPLTTQVSRLLHRALPLIQPDFPSRLPCTTCVSLNPGKRQAPNHLEAAFTLWASWGLSRPNLAAKFGGNVNRTQDLVQGARLHKLMRGLLKDAQVLHEVGGRDTTGPQQLAHRGRFAARRRK